MFVAYFTGGVEYDLTELFFCVIAKPVFCEFGFHCSFDDLPHAFNNHELWGITNLPKDIEVVIELFFGNVWTVYIPVIESKVAFDVWVSLWSL